MEIIDDVLILVRRDTLAGFIAQGYVPANAEPVAVVDAKTGRVSSLLMGNGVDTVDHLPPLNYIALSALAKAPDLLITGSINRDAAGIIATAAVLWPDGTPGLFTTDQVDPSGAINRYHVTYGSPAVFTFTQPTITRDSSGAASNVPQIVVS